MPSTQLKNYRRKRDFAVTTEPPPNASDLPDSGTELCFVVQKHDARRLHYDLRLEHDGVLLSWAVPKGPSVNPSNKRLAVRTEDHPLSYQHFEGVIPKGEYGGGTMLVWDRGYWQPHGNVSKSMDRGSLKFTLHGRRLQGQWRLNRMDTKDGRENWLLQKIADEHAHEGTDCTEPVEQLNTSIDSGLSLREIEQKNNGDHPQTAAFEWTPPDGAQPASMPAKVIPQLASSVAHPPQCDRWLHEIKYDGYRLLLYRHHDKATCLTRRGIDWTHRFPHIADALNRLPVSTAILDGEAVAHVDPERTSFQHLQNHLRDRDQATLAIYLFDLLYLDGYDLTNTPLIERKQLLAALLQTNALDTTHTLRYSDHMIGQGDAIAEQACIRKLEGIISKRADRGYKPGRSSDWVKYKCVKRQEFVIVGYTPPQGSREGFGALLLATRDNVTWVYHGKVGTGFDDRALRTLTKQLESIRAPRPNLKGITAAEARHVNWVRPELIVEVRFTAWTRDGRLRHPVFISLRDDKPANIITREEPMPAVPAVQDPSESGKNNHGVKLTHPQRVLYPQQGLTKQALADYYHTVAPFMLPYVANRPLALVRCPKGQGGNCFFQKHFNDSLPEQIQSLNVGPDETHIFISNEAGLIAMAQIGVLEVHNWGCRRDRIERPDQITFDLDPDETVQWSGVVAAARQLKQTLDTLELNSFLKLTGGKGLHLVVPIERRNTWDEIKDFARTVAMFLQRLDPQRYIAKMTKAKRTDRIYVDYLRNGRGATAVAPYSTRAKPNAPIAAPIRWDELSADRPPDTYTVTNIRQRLSRLREDPWKGYDKPRQWITRQRQAALRTIMGD